MAEIFQMPLSLNRLWFKLEDLVVKEAANREEWIEIQEGICFTLVTIRDQYSSNTEFGAASEENCPGLSKDTKWAAINMGREPEILHQCLEATNRTSLQYIYREEFSRLRCLNEDGTAGENIQKDEPAVDAVKDKDRDPVKDQDPEAKQEPPKKKGRGRPRGSKNKQSIDNTHKDEKPAEDKPKQQRTADYKERKEPDPEIIAEIHRRFYAGEIISDLVIVQLFGCGETTAGTAILIAQIERRVRAEPQYLNKSEMSATMQERYERTLRTDRKRLIEEIRQEERNALDEEFERHLKHWKDRVAKAEKIEKSRQGIMSRQDFMTVIACLHPDGREFERRGEAFIILNSLKDLLVKPDTPKTSGSVPSSVSELMAGRRRPFRF